MKLPKDIKEWEKLAKIVLRHKGLSKEEAKEIIQDVYVRLVKNHSDKIGEISRAYFLTAVRNMAIDYGRKRDREKDLYIPYEEELYPDGFGSAEDEYVRRELRESLNHYIKSLPEEDQQVIRFYQFNPGTNFGEMEREVGVSRYRIGKILEALFSKQKEITREDII